MFDKTISRIKKRFLWPFMTTQVQKFIASCEPCQLATHPHRIPRAPLQPIQLQVNRTLEFVTTDYIGPLKRTKRGNTSIVVIVDHKTKYGWIRATKTQEANHLAQILVNIQTEFGFLEMLHSDQGRNFESNLIAEMCELTDVNKLRTTSYHPESDGLSEKFNQTLIKMIKTNINSDHTNWDELLPELQYAYNVSSHSTTGVSPFFLMFGREPKCPLDLIIKQPDIQLPTSNEEFIANLKDNMHRAFEIARTNTQIKVDLSKINYDRKAYACMFKPGDKCWIRDHKPKPGLCNKFCSKYKGPYIVEQRFDNLVYKCKPLRVKGRHVTVHRNNMKAYTPRNVVGISSNEKTTRESDKISKPKRTIKATINEKAKETIIEQATQIKRNLRPNTTKQSGKSIEKPNKPRSEQEKTKLRNKLSKPILTKQRHLDQQQTKRRRGRPKKAQDHRPIPEQIAPNQPIQAVERIQPRRLVKKNRKTISQ